MVILCCLHSTFASNGISLPAVRFTLDLLKVSPNLIFFQYLEVYVILGRLVGLGSAYLTTDHEVAGSTSTILNVD